MMKSKTVKAKWSMDYLSKRNNLYGKVFKGEGFGSRIDFPTVNIFNESKTRPHIYIIEEKDYGEGCAFVTPDVSEIHFFSKIQCEKKFLNCKIISEVNRPRKSEYRNYISVLDIFMKGLDGLR